MDRDLLARLHEETRPETWLKSLAEAGVPFEGAGADLYRLAHALTNAEDALRDTHMVDKVAWTAPPKLGCGAIILYLTFWVIAAQQEQFEERLLVLANLLGMTCLVVAGVVLYTWMKPQLRRRRWQCAARLRDRRRPAF